MAAGGVGNPEVRGELQSMVGRLARLGERRLLCGTVEVTD